MMDRQEPFADDEQAGRRQQMMDVGDAAGDRILDRDHAEIGLARGDRGQRVLEGRARQRLGVRIGLDDGDMGIGARLALECDFRAFWSCRRPFSSRSGFGQYPAGGFEVGRGVDPARDGVDDGDVDPHPGLQRAQLLQLLLLLQRRGRQRHEPLQRGAAIGVEADVVVARAVAMGRRGAGEIERAQPLRRRSASRPPSPRWGPGPPPRYGSATASVAMSTAGSSSGGSTARMVSGVMVGKSPCRLTTISASAVGIERPHRLMDPVRAGGMVGAGHHRLAAMRPSRRPRSRACRWRPPPGRSRPPRPAAARGRSSAGPPISSSGLPGRRVAAMRAGISTRMRVSGHRERGQPAVENRPEIMGIGGKSARLYGLPEPGQTDISTLLRVRRESLIPDAHPRPFRRPSVDLPGLEPDPTMDSFELNKIIGAILGTCILVLVTSFAAHAIFTPKTPEKPGFEIAVKEDTRTARRQGSRSCAVRADREAAADRLRREGRRRRQEVRGLPHLREGRPQPRRPEPLWHRRREEGRGPRRLQFLGRHEGQGRRPGPLTTSTSSSPTRRASFRAPRWALPASRRTASAPT